MEYTITQTVEKKIQLTFPAFVQYSEHYYKINSEDKLIIVTDFSFSRRIEKGVMAHHSPFANEGWEFITEDVFNAAYHRVFLELSELYIHPCAEQVTQVG